MSKAVEAAHKPTRRRCLLCRQSLEKSRMLRLVVDDEGTLWPDVLQKAPGRGTYLCMQPACFPSLSDKRLGGLKQRFPLRLPQRDEFVQRLQETLAVQMVRQFSQLRSVAAVGRDAVMHRMWKNAPLLLILADDAGEAVVRQIRDAADKRTRDGNRSLFLDWLSSGFLGECFGRDRVATAALPYGPLVERLQLVAAWYRQAKESR